MCYNNKSLVNIENVVKATYYFQLKDDFGPTHIYFPNGSTDFADFFAPLLCHSTRIYLPNCICLCCMIFFTRLKYPTVFYVSVCPKLSP